MSALGSYAKACREKLHARFGDYSIRSVAKRIGIHHSYLSKLERGEHAPLTEATLQALARDLGENPHVICALGGKLPPNVTRLIKQNPNQFIDFIRDLERQNGTEGDSEGIECHATQRASELEELVRRLKAEMRERKSLELKVANDERQWRMILNHLHGTVVELLDPDLNVLWMNDELKREFGISEIISPTKCHRLLFASESPCPGCTALRAFSTGEIQTEDRFSPRGKRKWLVTNIPLRNRNGHIHQVLRFGFDITDIENAKAKIVEAEQREKYTAALQASEEKYRSFVESSSDVFYRTDAKGLLTMVSPAGVRLSGCESEAEMIGEHAKACWLYPEKRAEMMELLAARGEVLDYDITLRRMDGTPLYVTTSSRLIRDEAGNILGVEGTFRDITERRKAEIALAESEQKFRSIFENITDVYFRIDSEGIVTMVSPSVTQFSDYTVDEIIGRPVESFWMNPEERAPYRSLLEKHGELRDYGLVFKRKDGSARYISSSARVVFDNDGNLLWTEGTFRDITDRKIIEIQLRESNEMLQSVLDTIPHYICWKNRDSVFLGSNVNHARLAGFKSPLEVVGKSEWEMPWREEEKHFFISGDRRVMESDTPEYHIIEPILNAQGEERWLDTCKLPLHDAGGNVSGVLVIIEDITERKLIEEKLRYQALHDPLTGLGNRTLCLERIARAKEQAKRLHGSLSAVVFIDIHRFKHVNDSLGHRAGDTLLCKVAQILRACVREVDTVSRYGGDVFVIVLEALSHREVVRILKRIRGRLNSPMTIASHSVKAEASYGITYFSQGASTNEELLRNADIALHRSKAAGKNRMVVYRKGMHIVAKQAMALRNDMLRGLQAQEFFMVYQPIFTIDTGVLAGFEALIRWDHPKRGIVSPSDFIPLAEESGFIVELGQFALERSCQDMAKLLPTIVTKEYLTVSVNLSAQQLARPGLVDQVRQALFSVGLPPSRLLLEITESSLIQNPDAAKCTLGRLKDVGVGIALDDFGTGYSSMSVLQALPIDRLKIDMSFVSRMTSCSKSSDVVSAIINLGQCLGLQIVAEGIETEEQRAALRTKNCDMGQGYLCAHPFFLDDIPQNIHEGVCIPTVQVA